MADKLNVLVLESERGAADGAREALARAGHEVLACHEPGTPAFPCNGLAAGHHCPLDGAAVDVALDVRPRPRSQPAPLEDGVRCALQRHVPVVIAGSTLLNPYEDFDVSIVHPTDDVVGACERAARAPMRTHTDAAARMLREVLDRRGVHETPVVAVRRHHGTLVIDVHGAQHLDEATKSMASVRMTGAVRAIDRDARGVDVVFDGS